MIDPHSGGMVVPPKPKPRQVSVTELRRLGLAEITRELKKQLPTIPRKELRELARTIEKHNWNKRDQELIAKITTPHV